MDADFYLVLIDEFLQMMLENRVNQILIANSKKFFKMDIATFLPSQGTPSS
jgi:hypothetical protein